MKPTLKLYTVAPHGIRESPEGGLFVAEDVFNSIDEMINNNDISALFRLRDEIKQQLNLSEEPISHYYVEY